MDPDVQAELTRLRAHTQDSTEPSSMTTSCLRRGRRAPLAAPPAPPPPATNAPRLRGHGKTRDMCHVSRATTMPPATVARPRLSACIGTAASDAPGYRILSQSRTCAAPTFAGRFKTCADVDPYAADSFPGPGHYDVSKRSMAATSGGPQYSLGSRWWDDLSSTVAAPDADVPGPGAYEPSKY